MSADLATLPDAEIQAPACGSCGAETRCDEPDVFVCEECLLVYQTDRRGNLAAQYLDDRDEPCRTACDNTWHGDDAIKPGARWWCRPCALPTGHTSDHWCGCSPLIPESGGSTP